MVFVQLTSVLEFLYQTLPRLLDASSLENMNAKSVSCGARHSALITGMPSWICIGIYNSFLVSANGKPP